MAAKRPTNGTCLTKHTRSQKQIEKMTGRIDKMVKILEPHIHRFAKVVYEEEVKGFDAREESRKIFEEIEEYFDSPEGQEEIKEMKEYDEDYSGFEQIRSDLQEAAEKEENMTDEEFAKEDAKIVEEMIMENSRMTASLIIAGIAETLNFFFKDKGPQSLTIQEFVDEIDLDKLGLYQMLPKKYYTEIKGILRQLMPVLLRESLMYSVRWEQTYFEVFYSDNLNKIIMYPISWELVQIWANS